MKTSDQIWAREQASAALLLMSMALDAKDVPKARLELENVRRYVKDFGGVDEAFGNLFLTEFNRPEWEWPYDVPETTFNPDREVDALIRALDGKDPDEARACMKMIRLGAKLYGKHPTLEAARRLAQSMYRPEWDG
jgi:hypothetical protein